jgi:tRNA (guanine37-N1)-methyltransferase
MKKEVPFDRIGDIVLFKFDRGTSLVEKKNIAKRFFLANKSVKTALEKTGKIHGRLRVPETKFILGEDKRETMYAENHCRFKLNVDKTYFSPRLAHQRQLVTEGIARKVNAKKNKILVMFAGVAPFPIVLARNIKDMGKKALIVSSEINRVANKYAEENVKLNKLENYVQVISGNSKDLVKKIQKTLKFDFIIMARPNLKDTFLKSALKMSKRGTKIYYHGFGTKEKVLGEVKKDAENKIFGLKISPAGEIAPYKYRWLVEFFVK